MAHDVFFSYSTKDQKIVEGLSAYLEQNGIRCFIAYRDIPQGVVWAEAITEAIEKCRLMVVVFSEHFNSSKQVDREIEMCSEEGKPILTFRIQNAEFTGAKKYYLKNINWIDAFPNPEGCFGNLLNAVQRLLPDRTADKSAEIKKDKEQPIHEIKNENPKIQYFLKVHPNLSCTVWVDGELNTKVEADKIVKIPLYKGTFHLKFVSEHNKVDTYSCTCKMTDEDQYLPVDLESVVKQRLEKEKAEKEWIEKERLEKERLEKEKDEKERLEKERIERERLEKERLEKEKAEKERLEKERIEKERLENDRLKIFYDNGGFGIKDKITGEIIIHAIYSTIKLFSEGLAPAKKRFGKWGFINKSGKVILPFEYDNAGRFGEGLACVELNGKWGFIDKTGKEVIPLMYDDVERFENGKAKVMLDGKYFYIDKSGNRI